MAIVLSNAILVDFDPLGAEVGQLRIDGGKILDRGPSVAREGGDEVVDCGGAVVLPGLVNGHTHLYSALAVGMPAPAKAPTDFRQILERIWWRLDRALDAEAIELSARLGALVALRSGTTTLIDHHASPAHIAGSLDLIERGVADVGLRGVFCYETTDRHGSDGRAAGLDENRRYLEKCKHRRGGRFAALVGAHASFTLDDETLTQLASLSEQFDTGVHIHVAEDPCDEDDARARGAAGLIERLDAYFLIQPDAVFAHCTHLDRDAVARLSEMGVTVAHNVSSNMNNAVGYAPLAAFDCPVMLGTDGIGADMLAELRTAWLMSRHECTGLSPQRVLDMLACSARRATRALGVTLGRLRAGAAADVVLTDYVPFTPLHGDNVAGHVLYALSSGHVRSVLAGGEWALRDRMVRTRDAVADQIEAREVAYRLWQRMAELD